MSAGRSPLASAADDLRDALIREAVPPLVPGLLLPDVAGVAALATALSAGETMPELVARIQGEDGHPAARLLDLSILCQLGFQPEDSQRLQATALALGTLYRVRSRGPGTGRVRLLAVMAPGDLMVNTPLDFITAHLDVELTLLFLRAGEAMPPLLPDHDLVFFAPSEALPGAQERLERLFRAWPRPALNDPRNLPKLERAAFSTLLQGMPGVASAPVVAAARSRLEQVVSGSLPLGGLWDGADWPVLVRPLGSHAGTALEKLEDAAGLARYLAGSTADRFYVSQFIDYAGADGLFRKYRVAFIEGRPYLCHMAVSGAWMVHYLNAGMLESAAKRDEEARAMADFDTGFAQRHGAALRGVCDLLGFDYASIDCAETRDGRLLVFEADTAAIIHLMDAVEVFPYKHPQMLRIFAAFGALLKRRSTRAIAA
jgi:hypothetical protein